MSTPNKIAVVIVPGSFSPPSFYNAVVESLQQGGVQAVIVTMPTVGRRDPEPPATMSDDALAIAAVTNDLIMSGKNVVLVAHSYGGVPATQSMKYLTKDDSTQGNFRKLVYLTALVCQIGQSTIDFMGQLPDFLTVHDDYIEQEPVANAKLTFSDLSDEEGVFWTKRMPSHSTPSFKEGLGYAGYKDVELAYIVCENDMVIPLQYQEGMIQFLREQEGRSVDVHRIQSGHCPNASQPKQLADVIYKIVGTI